MTPCRVWAEYPRSRAMSGRATTTMYWSSETISMAKDRSARVAVDRFQPRLCGVDGDSRIRKTISPRVRYALGSDCALGERRVELVHREDGIDLRVSARERRGRVTGWSAGSASTSPYGAWPTCVVRRGSSSPWPSGSVDPA